MKKNLLTKVVKGVAFGDVSNASVRNILTEISKCMGERFDEKDMRYTLDFFDWKCPYTGKDLRKLIENNLGGYATDHIYPQNKEWCGLNVKGNLVIVDKAANAKKHYKDVETFLLTDTEVLKDLDEQGYTRQERLDKIKSFQQQCNYDPYQIRNVVSPLMEKRYDEIRAEQEKCILNTLNALKAVNIQTKPYTKAQKKKSLSTNSGVSGNDIKKYTYDEKIKVAAYYLRNDVGLVQIEENYLKIVDKRGWTARAILNELGIDTSRKSLHKNLLTKADIDDEIAKAAGTFKLTLEGIKKRGL